MWFRGKIECQLAAMIDFGSMYPNIMRCSRISPEDTDFYDISVPYDDTQHKYEIHICYNTTNDMIYIGIVIFAIKDVMKDCVSIVNIGSHHERINLKGNMSMTISEVIGRVIDTWQDKNDSIKNNYTIVDLSTVSINLNISTTKRGIVDPDLYPSAMIAMKACMRRFDNDTKTHDSRSYFWDPLSYVYKQGKVDWNQTPLGSKTIVTKIGSIIRHPIGINLASGVCDSLIKYCNNVRREIQKLKELKFKDDTTNEAYKNQDKIQVLDRYQWALKIIANLLYGSLSFAETNSYSPRAGNSVTAIGRWCSTVVMCIVKSLGCIPIYGDTNSVLFTIPSKMIYVYDHDHGEPEDILLSGVMNHIKRLTKHNVDKLIACDILCGGNQLDMYVYDYYQRHVEPFSNIVPKIINKVLEFTPLTELKMDTEPPKTGKWKLNQNTTVLSAKHYIGVSDTGDMLMKGITNVRRTGSVLGKIATEKFSKVVLSDSSRQDKIRTLRVQYTSLQTQINKPKDPRLFIIRQTTLGVTRDVVRLAASNGIKARFSDYHSDISLDEIDKKYYMSVLVSTLKLHSSSLDIHVEYITTRS